MQPPLLANTEAVVKDNACMTAMMSRACWTGFQGLLCEVGRGSEALIWRRSKVATV